MSITTPDGIHLHVEEAGSGTPILFIVWPIILTASLSDWPAGRLKEIVVAAKCP